MAFRRPRFKAIANLDARRKTRDADTEKIAKKEENKSERNDADLSEKCEDSDITKGSNNNVGENHTKSHKKKIVDNDEPPEKQRKTPTALSHAEEETVMEKSQPNEIEAKNSISETFKCPLILGKSMSTPIPESETTLTASTSVSMTPSTPTKPRQRIRPMPFFANRRNSIQGGLSETEEEPTRRTRHPSYSENIPNVSNRRRTESACSNISDNYSYRDNRIRKISTTATAATTEEYNNIRTNPRKEAIKRLRKSPEKSTLKMMDFIYYNPSKNPMVQNPKRTEESEKNKQEETMKEEEKTIKDDSTEKELTTDTDGNISVPAPQLKLGPNGEIILDEKSLVIETTGKKEAQKALQRSDVIYLDENTGSNGFYKRQKRTKDWSCEETIKFYRCLHAVGTDFSFMLTLFPNRTRRDLKLKFKKEEKRNLALVDKALMNPKLFNIDELKIDLEKEEIEAKEKQKRWDELKKRPLVTNKKQHFRSTISRAQRSLKNGNLAYENEHVLVQFTRFRQKANKEETLRKCEEYLNPQKMNDEVQLNVLETVDNVVEDEKNIPDFDVSSQEGFQNNVEDDFEEILTNFKVEAEKIDDDSEKSLFDKEMNLKGEDIETNNDSSSKIMDEQISKYQDIKKVLEDLQNGTLVIVASEDRNLPDKIINEIYVMCKETGELSDEPLDLPKDVTECIISEVMN